MNSESLLLGKYELRERLASGGQGVVWKAFDVRLHRFVAIKQLNAYLQKDPDSIARFEREAQLVASLHHPNIVQVHDFRFVCTPDANTSTAYMVMDYIEGPTLAGYIRNTSRQGQFPKASDIVTIFTAVSLALDYAHQKGMVHRDIKPANIMLDKRNLHGKPMGEPILMDFGLAKLQDGSAETTMALGTPLYVSPEQARGLSGDKRCDLYSLGIILYEIMTGITPFHGGSPLAILVRHYQELPTPPALINQNISPDLSAVILKSIAKDPDARFSSASAMTIALAEALNVPVPAELWRHGAGTSLTSTTTPLMMNGADASNLLSQSSAETEKGPAPTAISSSFSSPQSSFIASPMAVVPPANDKQIPTVISSDDSSAVYSPPNGNNSLLRSVVGYYKKRSVHIGSVILLAILGLGVAYYTLFPPNKGPVQGAPIAHLVFLSSQNEGGAIDEVQIVFPNIPDGQNYYAWLETHGEDSGFVHWPFTAQHGSISPPFYQQQNLLTPPPYLFLITRQSGNAVVPSFTDRLYYAPITQVDANHLTFNIMPCPQSDSNNICMS